MLNGPQSPAIRPGLSFIIRFERHVYQAGSRVGALIDGSCRNVQPNASSSPAITTTRIHGFAIRREVRGSSSPSVRSTVRSVFVSAMLAMPFRSVVVMSVREPPPHEAVWASRRACGRHGSDERIDDGTAAENTVSWPWPGAGRFWFL